VRPNQQLKLTVGARYEIHGAQHTFIFMVRNRRVACFVDCMIRSYQRRSLVASVRPHVRCVFFVVEGSIVVIKDLCL
jgi:hypothetical protein